MLLDDFQQIRTDVLGVFPVAFVPFLQQAHIGATDLDIEFNVVGEPGNREIGRPNQREGTHDSGAAVRDVGLRMELILAVDTTLQLPALDRIDHCGHAFEKVVFDLLLIQ